MVTQLFFLLSLGIVSGCAVSPGGLTSEFKIGPVISSDPAAVQAAEAVLRQEGTTIEAASAAYQDLLRHTHTSPAQSFSGRNCLYYGDKSGKIAAFLLPLPDQTPKEAPPPLLASIGSDQIVTLANGKGKAIIAALEYLGREYSSAEPEARPLLLRDAWLKTDGNRVSGENAAELPASGLIIEGKASDVLACALGNENDVVPVMILRQRRLATALVGTGASITPIITATLAHLLFERNSVDDAVNRPRFYPDGDAIVIENEGGDTARVFSQNNIAVRGTESIGLIDGLSCTASVMFGPLACSNVLDPRHHPHAIVY